jgi:hypothetical protein
MRFFMIVRILDGSMVENFERVGFDSDKFRENLIPQIDNILKECKNKNLENWAINFRIKYTNARGIMIKTNCKSYQDLKCKEIVAHIPIPTDNIVNWGVKLAQHVYKDTSHLDKLAKNFDFLEVEFKEFSDRHDYLIDSIKRIITFCFEKGLVINKEKVRIKPFILL